MKSTPPTYIDTSPCSQGHINPERFSHSNTCVQCLYSTLPPLPHKYHRIFALSLYRDEQTESSLIMLEGRLLNHFSKWWFKGKKYRKSRRGVDFKYPDYYYHNHPELFDADRNYIGPISTSEHHWE